MEKTIQEKVNEEEYSEQAHKYVIEVVAVCLGGAIVSWFLYGTFGGGAMLYVLIVNFAVAMIAVQLLFKRIDVLILKRISEVQVSDKNDP